MKKAVVFSAMFVVVFGLTIGMTIGLSDQAHAIWVCGDTCTGYNVCSTDTGPLCPGTQYCGNYYVYFHGTCEGGSHNCPGGNTWIGCSPESGIPGCIPCAL
jgi:hypothetical protein